MSSTRQDLVGLNKIAQDRSQDQKPYIFFCPVVTGRMGFIIQEGRLRCPFQGISVCPYVRDLCSESQKDCSVTVERPAAVERPVAVRRPVAVKKHFRSLKLRPTLSLCQVPKLRPNPVLKLSSERRFVLVIVFGLRLNLSAIIDILKRA